MKKGNITRDQNDKSVFCSGWKQLLTIEENTYVKKSRYPSEQCLYTEEIFKKLYRKTKEKKE